MERHRQAGRSIWRQRWRDTDRQTHTKRDRHRLGKRQTDMKTGGETETGKHTD